MSFRQRDVSNLSVWICATLVGLTQAIVTGFPDTWGSEFYLPYIEVSHCDLTVEIVPTFSSSEGLTVTVHDSVGGKKVDYAVKKETVLGLNYTRIFANLSASNLSGVVMTTSGDVSVYIKKSAGDRMVLYPTDAFGLNFIIPNQRSSSGIYHVYIFSSASETLVTVDSRNETFTQLSNMPEVRKDAELQYKIGTFETLKLESFMIRSVHVRGDNPLGVLFLTVDGFSDALNESCDQSMLQTLDSVPPVSAMGKLFYALLFERLGTLTLSVTAEEKTEITLLTNKAVLVKTLEGNRTDHFDCINVTHISIASSSPVQVFVSTQSETNTNLPMNAFFLPPIEQYFRLSTTNSCLVECPCFWTGCKIGNTSNNRLFFSFSATTKNVSIDISTDIYLHPTEQNVTIAKVQLNASFMFFLLDENTGSFLPTGTRLARLYSACVKNISAGGGLGDGADNDCDGRIDEEIANELDDDGDTKVDEDTQRTCDQKVRKAITEPPSSKDIEKSVLEAFLSGEDYVDEEDSEKPLIAVIVSLCVSIFAVFALISIYMLLELLSRRKQLRNTKIRPFVS